MPSLARASTPQARTSALSGSPSSAKTAAAKLRCNSRSVGTAYSQRLFDLAGFGNEHIERWQLRIPLNECVHGSETLKRRAVELPNGAAHGRRMGVDQELASSEALDAVAGEMDFLHRKRREGVQISVWIEVVIDCIHIKIIDVEEDGAAAFGC